MTLQCFLFFWEDKVIMFIFGSGLTLSFQEKLKHSI